MRFSAVARREVARQNAVKEVELSQRPREKRHEFELFHENKFRCSNFGKVPERSSMYFVWTTIDNIFRQKWSDIGFLIPVNRKKTLFALMSDDK